MACRKCEAPGVVIIKKEYSYCDSCYLAYINHKFRSCIGKNKVLTPNEKIVVGLSGGIGSTALLDLIHNGITLDTHKKLRVQPEFVHLTEEEDGHSEVAKSIIEQCKTCGFDVHVINISNYTSSDSTLTCDLTDIPKTASRDFISRIKQNILASVANDLRCRLIFTGEPATKLAAKLLSNLVIGRGSQVENDIGFSDNRYENIKILRPLRDITKEELQQYIKIKGLVPACNHGVQNGLLSIINSFVDTLECDSPSTISTICKTADKIGSDGCKRDEKSCVFCKGKLDNSSNKLTAMQATIFSRMVSLSNTQDDSLLNLINQEEINDKTMFPFVNENLCYCCSRSFAEIKGTKLQQHIQNIIEK